MKIVLIHGRSQQGKDPEILKEFWIDILRKGFEDEGLTFPKNIDIEFPFYGDILEAQTNSKRNSRSMTPENIEYLSFKAEVFENVLKHQNHLSIDGKRSRGIANWEWVQNILEKVDEKIPTLSARTLKTFTSDVYTYLTDTETRKAVDDVVMPHLTDENTIIISHSLGTVVAYNLLRELAKNVKYPLHITLGSPLGVRAIQRLLTSPLDYPQLLNKWTNIYDEKDIVALYPLDSKYFELQAHSKYIENINDVNNFTDNHHSIQGYLGNQYVVKTILPHLNNNSE